jgi:hypothetical protein
MRWVGHVASMGEMHIGFYFEGLNARDYLEDLDVDESIILE